MKKKVLNLIVAFAMILMIGICLTACGGKDDSLKVTLLEFEDKGITSVNFCYLDFKEYEAIEAQNAENKAFNDDIIEQAKLGGRTDAQIANDPEIQGLLKPIKDPWTSNKMRQQTLYGSTYDFETDTWSDNVYITAELEKSSYVFILYLSIPDAYGVNLGELEVKVKDETYPVIYFPMTAGVNVPFGDCYVSFIFDEIDSDVEIQLKGHTHVIPFTATVVLQDDPNANYAAKYNDAILFKCTKGNEVIANGVKASELKTLLDGKTFDDVLDFVAYDAPGYNFMKNQDFVGRFFMTNGSWDYNGEELKFTIGYSKLSSLAGFSSFILDYTVFSYVN